MVVMCEERETVKTSRKLDILIKCGVNCKINNLMRCFEKQVYKI